MNTTAENIMRDRVALAEQRQWVHHAPRGKEKPGADRIEKIAEILFSAKTLRLRAYSMAELGRPSTRRIRRTLAERHAPR